METTGLWRHRAFMLFWAGQSVSVLGSAVTAIALPLTAVAMLGASPAEMGLLGAAATLPHLLFGLAAGVWVDRLRRRPLMIAADLGRALLSAWVPVAALLGVLRIEQLYAVAFGVGALSLLFDVAATSIVPSLVGRERLADANGKVQLSESIGSVAGPSVGGVLVQLLTAPVAIAVDALSFLASVISLLFVRVAEAAAPRPVAGRGVRAEVGEGLRAVFGDPTLRAMVLGSAIGSLAFGIQRAVLVLYLSRDLGLDPAAIGAVFAAGGAAGIVGALLAAPCARWVGAGPAIVLGTLAVAVGTLAAPLAGVVGALAAAVLVMGQVLVGVGTPVYAVNQLSVRQAVTPDHLLGRVNASRRFLVFGVAPVGALVGGAVAQAVGAQAALAVGGVVMLGAFAWVYASPVRDVGARPRAPTTPAVSG